MNIKYMPVLLFQGYANDEPVVKNDWTNTASSIGQFFLLMFIFIIVLALAYFVTKWIAASKSGRKGGNIKVMEAVTVGNRNTLQLIKAGTKYYLIGVTKDKISFLTEVDDQSIDIGPPEQGLLAHPIPFEKYFNKFFNKQNGDENDKN